MRLPKMMLAIMLAGLGAAAYAQDPSASTSVPSARLNQHLNDLTTLLDLTDSQKLQMQQALESQHERMKAQFQQWKSSGQPPTHEQRQAAHQQMQQELFASVKPFLSDSQFTKFQLLVQRQHHGWHGHHGPPPPDAAPPAGSGDSAR